MTLKRFLGLKKAHKKKIPSAPWQAQPEKIDNVGKLVTVLPMPNSWVGFGNEFVKVKMKVVMSCVCPFYVLFMSFLYPSYILFMSFLSHWYLCLRVCLYMCEDESSYGSCCSPGFVSAGAFRNRP